MPFEIKASEKAKRTVNPIRAIVDKVLAGPPSTCPLKRIPLSLGDPTHFGNLLPPSLLTSSLQDCASSHKFDGYVPAFGCPNLRKSVAESFSSENVKYTDDDVVVASGCSGALELLLTGLLNPGQNILVPKPGFPLYEVIAVSHGSAVKYYDLNPSENWNVDLNSLESAFDENTVGVLINNPSNPCGSVFDKSHLKLIMQVCEKHKAVVIGDEVYGGMVFEGSEYNSLAEVSAEMGGTVPVVSCSGMAKQYLVPGMRVGWLTFYGPGLEELKGGVKSLSQVVLGACHLAQEASSRALDDGCEEFKKELNLKLQTQAGALESGLKGCHGLTVIKPEGAMYTMVKINVEEFKDIPNDIEFTKMLLDEKNVFALPGTCFGIENFFRAVYCAPVEMLEEAGVRIKEFCEDHKK
eukprot:CAMPEP_0182518986 /NCGR_PEP_ID=MMETSP1321-20130603/44857_1 /TAXON_ID=91990 /ORGANISM="Bolidomonas sp., Strain RCC1657" /LENGTH=408 /DNA_ID=CAMNT_0024726931 /DNA_START=456 /DNA_END=1682 /DNA_ORIENTATION=-